jgi:nickel/cobalt transporter (NiCoT) family protein
MEIEAEEARGNTLTMRIIGPIVTFVNRPWKMYPVGVLFGFGWCQFSKEVIRTHK